jgi:hypothetical protein
MPARRTVWIAATLALLPGCGGDGGGGAAPTPVPSPPPNVRLSTAGNTRPNEVAIAIDPANPMRLAAGSNLDWAYYSWDGGSGWEERRIVSNVHGVWGDPSVTFDADGRLFYAHLSNPPAPGYRIDRIVVQRSTDGGASFDDGAAIGLRPPRHQDKSWVAADATDSPYRGNVYVAWTEFDRYGSSDPNDHSRILFARSTDHGASWEEPVVVSDEEGDARDGDTTVEGAVPAIGPNGEVYLAWGGPGGIVFDRSRDGGRTFGRDVFVATQPGGWAFDVPGVRRANGMPVTVCDTSTSIYRGRVYVVWSDQRSGPTDTNVWAAWSGDGGATWSPPLRVNDDASRRHQFFQWAALDPATGHLHVVFYDRRDTTGNATDVFVARSTDGGATFQNARVSASSFTPDPSLFFGDYIGIAALDGRVYPVWTRMEPGLLSLWTALVDESTFY